MKLVLAALIAVLVLPEAVARLRLRAVAPPAGVFELYAAGDSTVAGEPFDRRLSFPASVKAMFPGGIGGRPVEVVNLARPGDSMYPQAIAVREAMRMRRRGNPAAVLIYCGHNERFTEDRKPGALESQYVAARSVALRWSAFAAWAIPSLERALRARGTRTLGTYERGLRDAIEASLAAGAVPVVSTLVSNLTEVEPTVDCGREDPKKIAALVKKGDWASWKGEAPCLAPLASYFLAKKAEKAGDLKAAENAYWEAVTEDPGNGFGRGTPAQNELIRRLAAEYRIPLVDSVALFTAASPRGLLGAKLFSDGHHPSLEGHLLLARGYAAALSERFGAPASKPETPEEALRRVRSDGTDLAAARLYSGRWLLTVSVGHPSPLGRLALAKRAFADAAALDPSDPRPKLGLELVATDADGAWLMKDDAAARIEPLGRPKRP